MSGFLGAVGSSYFSGMKTLGSSELANENKIFVADFF
jgi:hypothetical protein